MNAFTVKDLCKTYKKGNVIANNNINLDIKQGEIFGLLGPNGAGKTTLIKQMIGLLKPDKGDIKFFDIDVINNPATITYFIGYMPQRIGALADLSPYETLEVIGKLKGLSTTNSRKQCKSLIEEFKIDTFANRPLKSLSGGQNRLVSFCASLMGTPQVLVLDEPTDEIDPVNRKKIWDKLFMLNKERQITIILVTHNVIEAEKVLQRVALIDDGVIKIVDEVGKLRKKVSGQIKIEIELNDEEKIADNIFNDSKFNVVFIGNSRCWIYLNDKNELPIAVNYIVDKVGFELINDFRLLTPTLEDVYIYMNKEETNETVQ